MEKKFMFCFIRAGYCKRILFSDILYLKACGDYTEIHMQSTEIITTHKTMKFMEEFMPHLIITDKPELSAAEYQARMDFQRNAVWNARTGEYVGDARSLPGWT